MKAKVANMTVTPSSLHFRVNWILTEAELGLKFHKYVSEFPQLFESGEPMLFFISAPQIFCDPTDPPLQPHRLTCDDDGLASHRCVSFTSGPSEEGLREDHVPPQNHPGEQQQLKHGLYPPESL